MVDIFNMLINIKFLTKYRIKINNLNYWRDNVVVFKKSILGCNYYSFFTISFAECNFNCSSPKISKTKKHSYMSIRGVAVTTYVPPKKINRDKSLIFWNPRPDQFSCLMSSSTPKTNSNFRYLKI